MKIQGSKGNAYANRLGANPKFSRKRWLITSKETQAILKRIDARKAKS